MSPVIVQNQINAVNNVVLYCEDIFTCRRVQLLAFFNQCIERGAEASCCDVCRRNLTSITYDYSTLGIVFIDLIGTYLKGSHTLNHVIDIIMGAVNEKVDTDI